MSGNITKVPIPGGGEILAREVEFEPIKEPWCEYRLLDGGTVKIRATALKIFRTVDEQGKPTHGPDGMPGIVVTQQNQVVASE
jgi:hypothetical protein